MIFGTNRLAGVSLRPPFSCSLRARNYRNTSSEFEINSTFELQSTFPLSNSPYCRQPPCMRCKRWAKKCDLPRWTHTFSELHSKCPANKQTNQRTREQTNKKKRKIQLFNVKIKSFSICDSLFEVECKILCPRTVKKWLSKFHPFKWSTKNWKFVVCIQFFFFQIYLQTIHLVGRYQHFRQFRIQRKHNHFFSKFG